MARHSVHDYDEGGTSVESRVIERMVSRRLATLDGLRKVKARVVRDEVIIAVVVDRDADLDTVRAAIDDRLDIGFWIDSGMADLDYSVDITRSSHA